MSVISLNHLSKFYKTQKKEPGFSGFLKSFFNRTYETVKAVQDISFEIEEGELVGFIGPNGAGKTTTLKCLSGLLYPTSGKVSVLGYTPFDRRKEFLSQISLVMGQKNQLWWDLPVLDSIKFNKEIYEISDDTYKKVLSDLTEILDVKNLLAVQAKKLSLGERMKFELISALIHSPKVLFLDEPTIGLDVVMQKKLREFIKEYNSRFKATIVLTSHYMKDVEALCKRVIVIDKGSLLYDGLLMDLIKKHAPYKIIKVIFDKEVNKEQLKKFGQIGKFEFPELLLRVPYKKTGEVATALLETFEIQDLNIEDPDIEFVIREIFSKNKE